MFSGLRHRMTVLARRSAFGVAGAVLLLVAAGFFTAAGWYGLLPKVGPVWAAAIIGTVYLVLGLVCLLLARGEPEPELPLRAPATPMERVVASFLDGMEAGSRVRRSRR